MKPPNPKLFYKMPHFPHPHLLHEFIMGSHLCYVVSDLSRNETHSSLNYLNFPSVADFESFSTGYRKKRSLWNPLASDAEPNEVEDFFRYQLSREEQHMRILCAETPSEIYVCFHGTESTISDWKNNVNYQLEVDRTALFPSRLHRGIKDLFYRSVPWVQLAKRAKDSQKRLVFFGHSRGGALAFLTAAAVGRLWQGTYDNFQAYSLAGPMTGDYNFSQIVDHLGSDKFQSYFFKQDPFPFLLTQIKTYEPAGELYMMNMDDDARDLEFQELDRGEFFHIGSEMISFLKRSPKDPTTSPVVTTNPKDMKKRHVLTQSEEITDARNALDFEKLAASLASFLSNKAIGSSSEKPSQRIKKSAAKTEKVQNISSEDVEDEGDTIQDVTDTLNQVSATVVSGLRQGFFKHHRMEYYYSSIQRGLHLENLSPLAFMPKRLTEIIPKPRITRTKCTFEDSGLRVRLEGKFVSGIMDAALELKTHDVGLNLNWSDTRHHILEASAVLPSSLDDEYMEILFPSLPSTMYITSTSARLQISNIFFSDTVEIEIPLKNVLIFGVPSSGKSLLINALRRNMHQYQEDDFAYLERPFIQEKFSHMIASYAPQLCLLVLPSDRGLQYLDRERIKKKIELFQMVHTSVFLVFSRYSEESRENVEWFLSEIGREHNTNYIIEEESKHFFVNSPNRMNNTKTLLQKAAPPISKQSRSSADVYRDDIERHPISFLHHEICAYFASKQLFVHPKFSYDWDLYRQMFRSSVEEIYSSVIPEGVRTLFATRSEAPKQIEDGKRKN